MLRKLAAGLGLIVLGSTLLLAKQGTVVTKDGHTYEGDVTEEGDTVEITGVQGLPGPVKVNKANVTTLSYADNKVGEEVLAGLKKLDAKDVTNRILLAKAAMKGHAYEAAREVLVDAAKIEPNNPEVADLMKQLAPHLALPATRPATMPTTVPVAPLPAPVNLAAKRQVSPAEINYIRQLEWRGPDDPTVKVQVKPETKTRFLEANPDVTKADFNQMTANQQAALILSKGPAALFGGVILSTDPASIVDFKSRINTVVVRTCGTNCHSGANAGNFSLVPTTTTAAIYTNFVMLQQYKVANGGPLVDRANPESSLLLQYMLDPTLTKTPHRAVKGFKAPVRSTNDARYVQVLHWIESLNPIAPHYGIDLTQALPAPAPGK